MRISEPLYVVLRSRTIHSPWLALALVACSSPAAPPPLQTTGTGAANAGAAAQVRADGTSSMPNVANAAQAMVAVSPTAPSSDDCNKVEIEFAPREPSVFILVDRSSSMFEHGLWNPLKDGVLAVIAQLEQEMRFGFSSYTGQHGMQCPDLSTLVPLAEHNYDAIKRAYDAVAKPEYKAETPTSLALQAVTQTMLKEAPDGPKYILLVTDGEPDFCDDPNVTCSRDAVVAAVQAAYAQNVGTFIISVGGEVDRGHLGDVANAGVGQPVADRNMAVHYQCPASTAMYSAASGQAPFFEPDVSDRAALVDTLTGAIAGVRSCVFDLQGRVKIDLALADQGMVEIDGSQVAFGAPDGYRMNSETQLELLGQACTKLKLASTRRVLIDFPCRAIELL